MSVRDLRDRRDVRDMEFRVPDAFGVDSFRAVVDERCVFLRRFILRHEFDRDAEFLEENYEERQLVIDSMSSL
jgi:hypothetical protein